MSANISRESYLEKLIASDGDGMIKIVTGLRRCGKSYLLFNLFRKHLKESGVRDDHVVEIALDQMAHERLRDPLLLAEHIREKIRGRGKFYVLIDEIQMCRRVLRDGIDLSCIAPEDRDSAYVSFYDVLNEFQGSDKVEVYVTGSNSKTLSSDIATNFRGRGEVIQVHPLSFKELLRFKGGDERRLFREYMVFGGMPAAVLKDGEIAKKEYLESLFREVYLRDLKERYKIGDDSVLDKVNTMVSSSIGSLTNPSKLAKAIFTNMQTKTSVATVKRYLDMLEDAFLIRKADRYDVKGKRYLEYPSKYYVEDTGIRNALLAFRQLEQTHLMENVVFNELVRRGFAVDVGVVYEDVRKGGTHQLKQREIDFVVNSPQGKVYIQSALNVDDDDKHEREIVPFRLQHDFFARLVVTGGDQPLFTDATGISHVGIIPFLLDEAMLAQIMK